MQENINGMALSEHSAFGTARRGLGRAAVHPGPSCCTKCNSPPING